MSYADVAKKDYNFSIRTSQPDEDTGDFLLLGETNPGNMDNLSHRIRVSSLNISVIEYE
jgi:hypothetical protein